MKRIIRSIKRMARRLTCRIAGHDPLVYDAHNQRVHCACKRCGTKWVEMSMISKVNGFRFYAEGDVGIWCMENFMKSLRNKPDKSKLQ